MTKSDSRLLRRAYAVMRSEFRAYDAQVATPKLRVIPATMMHHRDEARPALPGWSCAHDVPLVEVCSKCGRLTDEDLKPYRQALASKVKEILNTL